MSNDDRERRSANDEGRRAAGAGGEARSTESDDLAVQAAVMSHVAGVLHEPGVTRIALDAVAATIAEPAPGRRAGAERGLLLVVESELTGLWRRGWQPADLVRAARRRQPRPQVALLLAAVAADLSRYAAATVEPRWHDQMAEHGVTRWWGPEVSYLRAVARQAGDRWQSVVRLVLDVLVFVSRLPALEVLDALPGRYAAAPRTKQASVDAKILSRVRALLAKAESTTFPAEAETFTAGAQSLMARHSIDAALLAATANGPADGPRGRRIGVDNPYESSKVLLLDAVARANRCRTVWAKAFGCVTVVGFAADLDGVEALFTSLLVQATSAMSREGARADRFGRSTTRSFRRSFLAAYAQRIGERLAEVAGLQTRQAAAAVPGQDLLPVLAARLQQVDGAVTDLFPHLVRRPFRAATHGEGWASGRSAADRAVLRGAGALAE